MVRGAIVKAQRVAVWLQHVPAWEDYVAHIAHALVILLRPEDPLVAADQAALRGFQVEERQPQAVQRPGGGRPHPVINHQPAALRLDRRVTQTDLVGVPPGAAPRFEHELVRAPVLEVVGIRDPHVRAHKAYRAVDERPLPVDAPWQQGRILILRGHDDAQALECPEVPGQCHGHARTAARVRGVQDGILLQLGHIGDAGVFHAPDLFRKVRWVRCEGRLGIDLPVRHPIPRARRRQV